MPRAVIDPEGFEAKFQENIDPLELRDLALRGLQAPYPPARLRHPRPWPHAGTGLRNRRHDHSAVAEEPATAGAGQRADRHRGNPPQVGRQS